MCLNCRMGKNRRTVKNRRTARKSRTAKKRQNGGVIFMGAPVSYSIPFGQRQPTEAIMERATTVGGNPNKVQHYPLYGKLTNFTTEIKALEELSAAKNELLQEQGEQLQKQGEELQKCKNKTTGGKRKGTRRNKRKGTRRNKRKGTRRNKRN